MSSKPIRIAYIKYKDGDDILHVCGFVMSEDDKLMNIKCQYPEGESWTREYWDECADGMVKMTDIGFGIMGETFVKPAWARYKHRFDGWIYKDRIASIQYFEVSSES
jgi:hypothetical protein